MSYKYWTGIMIRVSLFF